MLKENRICFKCLDSDKHVSSDCPVTVICNECGGNHNTAMHSATPPRISTASNNAQPHGGERQPQARDGDRFDNTSLQTSQLYRRTTPTVTTPVPEKIIPVNIYHRDIPNKYIKIYAILDEQSNKSLAKKELFDEFNIQSQQESYTLSTCSGRLDTTGRRSKGFIIESLDGNTQLDLPTIIECEGIPNNRNEISTPEVAMFHPHLEDIAHELSPLDCQSDILSLIGRDLMEAHC